MNERDSESHRRKKNAQSDTMSKANVSQQGASIPDCAVCLQTCIHPVELPCSHVFCYLCMKGASTQFRRCALCRQEIPVDYFTSPKLLVEQEDDAEDDGGEVEVESEDNYTWFYEGRNGWWQYEERTRLELEESYKANKRTFELLIAGYVYVIDLDSMLQYRRSDPSRRRRMKRDLVSAPKKGIAGLKIKVKRDEESAGREVVGAEEEKENAGAVGGRPAVPSSRKSGKSGTDNEGESSHQVAESVDSDDGITNARTSSPSANPGRSSTEESVYEVHLTTFTSPRTPEASSTDSRAISHSQRNALHSSTQVFPQQQRRMAEEPQTTNLSGRNVSVLPSSALPIHHQRTRSAPEVRPSGRPRTSAPQAPPRTSRGIGDRSSNPPLPARREEASAAAAVDSLSERMRSELVVSISRGADTQEKQGHGHVHEV